MKTLWRVWVCAALAAGVAGCASMSDATLGRLADWLDRTADRIEAPEEQEVE